MSFGERMRWWGLGLALLLVAVWLLSGVLFPFILGAALAYMADPLADRLQRLGLSRLQATVALTVTIAGVGIAAAFFLVPVLFEQVRSLLRSAPLYIEMGQRWLSHQLPRYGTGSFRQASEALKGEAQTWSVALLQQIWQGGIAVVDFLAVAVIAPVVAFYLLHDWDMLIARIDDLIPRPHRETARRIAHEIDDVLAGFVRGQLTVCLVLGTFYAVALTLVGLNFGLLVGLFAGLISFIPFVGSITGLVLSLAIAAAQFWQEPGWIVVIFGVFLFGQTIEGNYLTPTLVGGHVKLHPLWLMLALSVFGGLLGFVGLLAAVPTAATLGVLARFGVEVYKSGSFYRGAGEGRRLGFATASPEAAALPDAPATAGRDG